MKDLLLTNIKQLAGIRDASVRILKGKELSVLPAIENAFLWIRGGKIDAFGKMDDPDLPGKEQWPADIIDCSDRIVLPAFCDSHTHLVFADTREGEFMDKIKGLTYEEIAARGGGILNSAARLRAASEDSLFEKAWERLLQVMKQGTGAIEIKSGYGLSPEAELKMLRVIRRLKEKAPVPVKATFLGAHAIPPEYKNNREGYIRLVIEEMLPAVEKEGLADYMDVFCDKNFFTPEETGVLLEAGLKHGLKPKIHANQLAVSGGVQAGIRHHAVSVDHLEAIGEEEILALQQADTTPTLLPSAAFFLRMGYPPAVRMIEAGLPVTLATDYNPGSSPSGRMSFVVSLACLYMKMTPEEALNAATLNGAAAMELSAITGSITKGKCANLIITHKINSIANIPYSFGQDVIDTVLINGKVA